MKLNELDSAIYIRDALDAALKVRTAVNAGHIDVSAHYNAERYDPYDYLTSGHAVRIRDEILECLTEIIDRERKKLTDMGIELDITNTPETDED